MITYRAITKVDQLDALPDRSVVIDKDGDPWVHHSISDTDLLAYWTTIEDEEGHLSEEIPLSATLVYREDS